MGMYDTVIFKNSKGEDCGIQFKLGKQILKNYMLGEDIPLDNGLYFAKEGMFVVFDNKLVAAFDSDEKFMVDKWGGEIGYPELWSPIDKVLNLTQKD